MLTVHRAERADTLADQLANLLTVPLGDPFDREVVAVPAQGVERWLTQRLSATLGARSGDGVAANIDFSSPARLVERVLAQCAGLLPEDDPWSRSRLLWTVLTEVDACIGEPWCAVLARHLGHTSTGAADEDDHRRSRRYATAAHLASLYAGYAAQRPTMLRDWQRGDDTDGLGGALADDLHWQAELWRRVRGRIGSPGPAERLEPCCAQLRDSTGVVDLPERLSVFGPTRLATDQLTVLSALAERRDVHVWLPHPSPAMWATMGGREHPERRSDDRRALLVRNPLLANLGRDVREMRTRLAAFDVRDVHHRSPEPPETMLGRLQRDIRDDRDPAGAARLGDLLPEDGTVRVHACHGAARQVEVLREVLLHLFQSDSTLQPRDVVVMCPDIEVYAPLVRAAFGQKVPDGDAGVHHDHPGHELRVRLADRALRQVNAVLSVIATLIELADARVTASQVLDLAAAAPVARAFGFDEDDLEQLREWTADSGVRWGIGPRQRVAFGLDDVRQNTFRAGLDRMLLGAAADERTDADAPRQWLGLALPLQDVDSNDIDLAGRFGEFIDRLDVSLRGLRGPQAVSGWSASLVRALDLLVDVAPAESWQLAQAHRELAEAFEDATVEGAGDDPELRIGDIRTMLAGRLAGRPTRTNFRTGELTVCTMVPMRSVPHRVVLLLGMDDDLFPRRTGVDGDDVLARDPAIGERDPRSEDRQLLLDAVMAAREQLIVLYTGADPVTGARRPPAIPLAELIDTVALTAGPEAAEQIVHRHPLQHFDPHNFRPAGRANPYGPFSFDRRALSGAQASLHPSAESRALLARPLPPAEAADIDIAELAAFLVQPIQGFLRQRVGVWIPEMDEDVADALDTELDGLTRWDIGERMLVARLGGATKDDFEKAEWRRGTLPPFELGQSQLNQITPVVEDLVAACMPLHAQLAETVDVEVDLGAGRRLVGTVGGVRDGVLVTSTYSQLKPKQRLTAWIKLLAVAATCATAPGSPARKAITTGRGRGGLARSVLTAPPDARTQLLRLVELRDKGLCWPLPAATGASAQYADQRHRGGSVDSALGAAGRGWGGDYGDNRDPHIIYVHGAAAELDVLTESSRDEAGLTHAAYPDEPSGFGEVARRLWEPLLAAEEVGQP